MPGSSVIHQVFSCGKWWQLFVYNGFGIANSYISRNRIVTWFFAALQIVLLSWSKGGQKQWWTWRSEMENKGWMHMLFNMLQLLRIYRSFYWYICFSVALFWRLNLQTLWQIPSCKYEKFTEYDPYQDDSPSQACLSWERANFNMACYWQNISWMWLFLTDINHNQIIFRYFFYIFTHS